MHMHGQSPCYAKAKFLLNSAYDNTSYSAEGKASQSMNTMGVTGLEVDGINRNVCCASVQRPAYNTHSVMLTLCSSKASVQLSAKTHSTTLNPFKEKNLQEFPFCLQLYGTGVYEEVRLQG